MRDVVPNVETLRTRTLAGADGYAELLRVPAMSVGVYVLPPGSVDRQTPHREDEVYYVVRGQARFLRGKEERAVSAGDVLFVAAQEPHHFLSIEEELVLLVVFAPAEQTTS
jgi:mannose-6-phosphate isomerase-like protein (cupin superfamily)